MSNTRGSMLNVSSMMRASIKYGKYASTIKPHLHVDPPHYNYIHDGRSSNDTLRILM